MLEDRANLGVRVRPANRNSMKRRRLYDRAGNHVTRIEARVNTTQDYTQGVDAGCPRSDPAARRERSPTCSFSRAVPPELASGRRELAPPRASEPAEAGEAHKPPSPRSKFRGVWRTVLGQQAKFGAQPKTRSVGVARTCQPLGLTGWPWLVTELADVIAAPFIVHSANAPLEFSHTRSAFPSPLKSPIAPGSRKN
jgi:hypothetical protein